MKRTRSQPSLSQSPAWPRNAPVAIRTQCQQCSCERVVLSRESDDVREYCQACRLRQRHTVETHPPLILPFYGVCCEHTKDKYITAYYENSDDALAAAGLATEEDKRRYDNAWSSKPMPVQKRVVRRVYLLFVGDHVIPLTPKTCVDTLSSYVTTTECKIHWSANNE